MRQIAQGGWLWGGGLGKGTQRGTMNARPAVKHAPMIYAPPHATCQTSCNESQTSRVEQHYALMLSSFMFSCLATHPARISHWHVLPSQHARPALFIALILAPRSHIVQHRVRLELERWHAGDDVQRPPPLLRLTQGLGACKKPRPQATLHGKSEGTPEDWCSKRQPEHTRGRKVAQCPLTAASPKVRPGRSSKGVGQSAEACDDTSESGLLFARCRRHVSTERERKSAG